MYLRIKTCGPASNPEVLDYRTSEQKYIVIGEWRAVEADAVAVIERIERKERA